MRKLLNYQENKKMAEVLKKCRAKEPRESDFGLKPMDILYAPLYDGERIDMQVLKYRLAKNQAEFDSLIMLLELV